MFHLKHLIPIIFTKREPKTNTAQKTKFSIKDFFSKCDQIP